MANNNRPLAKGELLNAEEEFAEAVQEYIRTGLEEGFTLEEIRQNMKKDLESTADDARIEQIIH